MFNLKCEICKYCGEKFKDGEIFHEDDKGNRSHTFLRCKDGKEFLRRHKKISGIR